MRDSRPIEITKPDEITQPLPKKIAGVKSVTERQAERGEKIAELGKCKADMAKANSIPALRAELIRIAEIIEKLL